MSPKAASDSDFGPDKTVFYKRSVGIERGVCVCGGVFFGLFLLLTLIVKNIRYSEQTCFKK